MPSPDVCKECGELISRLFPAGHPLGPCENHEDCHAECCPECRPFKLA